MANCPTCGRAMLSEWPHDHRTADPDAALRETVVDLITEGVNDGLYFPDKRERLADEILALAATASPGHGHNPFECPDCREVYEQGYSSAMVPVAATASPGLDVERRYEPLTLRGLPMPADPDAALREALDALRFDIAGVAYELMRRPNGPSELRGELAEIFARHESAIAAVSPHDKTDLYREMYKAVAEKWAALLERYDLDPDSSPDDVVEAATASPGLGRADLDTFIAGLDSPNHSEQSRRDWCRLFFRDMQRAASPGLDVETDGLAQLISTILRKYGGTMKGRGDHDIFDALVRYRAALVADRETPEGWTLKDVRE